MDRIARAWNMLVLRFADLTGFPPTGRALALALAASAAIAVAICAAVALSWSHPYADAGLRNRGFGPDWQCDNASRPTFCFRRRDADRNPVKDAAPGSP